MECPSALIFVWGVLERVVYVLETLEKGIISVIYHRNEYMSHA